MRLFLFTMTLILGLGAVQSAHASVPLDLRVQQLERQVNNQNLAIDELFSRLDRMDQRGGRGYGGPGGGYRAVTFNCLVTDSGYNKSFLGSGTTQLDAEFNAKKACQSAVSPSYCTVTPKCDNTRDGAQGAVCVITDSGYNKSFRGEGSTPIAAEANAKASCQASVSPSYCAVTARCESRN